MEQRAREMGKTSQAAVYRAYINQMKKKTKKKNESFAAVAGALYGGDIPVSYTHLTLPTNIGV